MEDAKEKIQAIRYNTNLERLQIEKKVSISQLLKTVKSHKIISMAIISLIIFSSVYIIMIYQFIKILQNI